MQNLLKLLIIIYLPNRVSPRKDYEIFLIAVMLGNIGGIADTRMETTPFDPQQECLDFARPEGYYGIRNLETISRDRPY